MKRLLITITLAIALAICFSVSAFASTIETNDYSVIQEALDNATEGETVTVNMTGDVLVPNTSSAIKLEKSVTLVINTNGHTIYTNPGSASAGSVYGFLLNSGYAKLVVNGQSSVDAMNYVVPSDENLTVSNGVIVDPNDANGVKSPDFASNGPAIFVKSGSIEFNNVYFRQYNNGEWGIFCSPNSGADYLVTNFKAINSILRQPDSCSYGAIGTRGGNYEIHECLFEVDNSVIYGTNDKYWAMSAGSYVKNSRFTRLVIFDGYMDSGETNRIPQDKPVEFTNVIFENPNLTIGGGTIHINLIDCQFPNGMNINVYSDRNGEGTLYMTQTATCKTAGKQVYTRLTSSAITSFEGFPNVVEQYTIDNPAIPHSATDDNDCTTDVLCDMCKEVVVYPKQFDAHKLHTLSIKYANGFAKEGLKTMVCENCESATNVIPTLPLFVAQGYTVNEGNTGFGTGFQINKDALVEYESANNTTITFGIVVFNPQHLNGETFVDGKINATKGALQFNMDTSYANCKLLISGFTQAHASLELVFVGYAYEGDNSANLQLMQKEYISTENAPVESPMCSQINGLYTVKLSTVATPSMVGNKESLDEFVKKTA
ncbi:MAG: hypothetical protein IJF11_02235 [Clostridia bacterium]|nr:hypothetical protein [Clostridia bacterium]